MQIDKRWINGPDFLHRSEENWPKSDFDLHVIPVDDPEVKRDLKVNAIAKKPEASHKALLAAGSDSLAFGTNSFLYMFSLLLTGISFCEEYCKVIERNIIVFCFIVVINVCFFEGIAP